MASSKKIENLSPDEDVRKITQDSLNSAIRQSNRIRTFSDLGISTLKNLPATIGMVQSFMKNVNWRTAQEEVLNGLNHTVVIVIPISGKTGENIAEELIPTMIEASPEAALVIGHELPAYRRSAAQRIIRNATFLSLAAGIEPIPLIDIPILLGVQIRLVLRVAALYGEPIDSSNFMLHARALISTMAGGLGFRFLAEQAAKVVPFGGDFVAGAIAGAATWSMG